MMLDKNLKRLNQQINRTEAQKRMIMNELELTSHQMRRARTRSLVALGGLVAKSGLLETFDITLGEDLQKNLNLQKPVAALFRSFLELNAMLKAGDLYIPLMVEQGLEEFGKLKRKN